MCVVPQTGLRIGICTLSPPVIMLLKMFGLLKNIHQTGDGGYSEEWDERVAGREEKGEISFLLYLFLGYLNYFHSDHILIS